MTEARLAPLMWRGARMKVAFSGLCAVIALALITEADATTFTVTNASATGAGSLRQAVLDANAAGGADTITFAPGVTGTIKPGALTITGPTTISGPGAGVLTVSGDNTTRPFEIAGTASVTISGLTIADGKIEGGSASGGSATGGAGGAGGGDGGQATGGDANAPPEVGGGIANHGDLTLDHVVVTGNRGIGGLGGAGGDATGGSGGSGGAGGAKGGDGGGATGGSGAAGDVRGVGIFNDGSMTIRASTVSGNSGTAGDGGDAKATGGTGGTGIVVPPVALGGRGGDATSTGVSGGDVRGAGLYNAGTMKISASTVSSNTAVGANGGDAQAVGGAGGMGPSGTGGAGGAATAAGGAGGEPLGAGIFNAGILELRDTTIAANIGIDGQQAGTATGTNGGANSGTGGLATATPGAAGVADGGGLLNSGAPGATATLSGVTFAGNRATTASNLRGGDGLTISSSIVTNPTGGGSCAGAITSGGFNIDSASSCGLTAATDRQQTDPGIGPLQDNGGPTATMAPTGTSPAIDQGFSGGSTTDQRGLLRPTDSSAIPNAPGGDGSDIGAVELAATDLPLRVDMTAAKKQKGKKLQAVVSCSKDCEIEVSGKGKAGGDKFKTKHAAKTLLAGVATKVKLKLKPRVRKKIAGEKGKATLAVVATAGAETASDQAKVKLKP